MAQLNGWERRYWSGIRLAPMAPVLLEQLTSFEEDVKGFHQRKANLEQVPYALGGMCYSFYEFIRIQSEIIRIYPPEKGVTRVVSSEVVDPLAFMFDAFLDHARRVSNGMILYLGAKHKRSFPSSMSDFIKKLENNKKMIPEERDIVVRYWRGNGSKVKAYRDLAQHHALLASECRVFLGENDQPGIYLALPNNPEIKSISKLSYSNPTVHAFGFMRWTFYETIRFVNRVFNMLLDPNKSTTTCSLGPILRTPIGPNQEGNKVVAVEYIDGGIQKILLSLNKELNTKDLIGN